MRTFEIIYNDAIQGWAKANTSKEAIKQFKEASKLYFSTPMNSPIYDGIKAK